MYFAHCRYKQNVPIRRNTLTMGDICRPQEPMTLKITCLTRSQYFKFCMCTQLDFHGTRSCDITENLHDTRLISDMLAYYSDLGWSDSDCIILRLKL